jgi:ABC-type dipeptide/oligopeptide/nickel transport system ATPase component
MQDDDVLNVERLSVDFRTSAGRLHALRDVSLAVPRGRIVGIVGESGCGKSTLINAVMGLLAANAEIMSGEIQFNNVDLLQMPPEELRRLRGDRITTVLQDPMTSLNPVFSIGTQMTAIQYRSGAPGWQKRLRAIEFLKKVRIPDPERRLSQYPHQFSGGMRQRICIAMALLTNPDLLIADEPTTALDATLEVQVIRRRSCSRTSAARSCSSRIISAWWPSYAIRSSSCTPARSRSAERCARFFTTPATPIRAS